MTSNDIAVIPKIFVRLTRPDGRTVEIKTATGQAPTPEMIALAERLIEFITTGVDHPEPA